MSNPSPRNYLHTPIQPLSPRAQAGAIPFRRRGPDIQVMLVTSRDRRRWVIPKGHINVGWSAADSARAEALEEAGVSGAISESPVGKYRYKKRGTLFTVAVFLLRVETLHQTWKEQEQRSRRWIPLVLASELVGEEELKILIRGLPDLIPASLVIRT